MTKKSETAFRRRLFGFSSGISCCGHHAPTRGLLLRRDLRPVRYHLTANATKLGIWCPASIAILSFRAIA
jgi:hypothetical protein